jgi:hypothetical protein
VYENRILHRPVINSGDTDRLRLKWHRRLSDEQFVEFHFHGYHELHSGIAEFLVGRHGSNAAVYGPGALL